MHLTLRKLQRKFTKSSSLQIILVAIVCHFIISISLLHFFITWFFENKSAFENDGLHRFGGQEPLSDALNLIRNSLISKNEISVDGWWFDHYEYQKSVECFRTGQSPCSKVFSTECKPDRIRAVYQFVPIRDDFSLHEIEVSLFAATGKLTELNEDKSFGLQMIIQLSNGEVDYLNIEFSYDLDNWYKRKARFNTYSRNLRITQITVMLFCYGYTGKVMFRDVVITPANRTQTNQLTRDDIVSSCREPQSSNHFSLPEYLTVDMNSFMAVGNEEDGNRPDQSTDKVTLVSQVSMDRMQTLLERTLVNWAGPISLVIHVPVKDIKSGLEQWQLIYLEKKLRLLSLNSKSKVVLLISDEKENVYPINAMRNAAFKNVQTDYAFLVDADFIPCPDIESKLERYLRRNQFRNYDPNKLAFVVPAFEYIENQQFDDAIPRTKEELMELIFREEPIIQPFRIVESIESHRLTNYWKFYISNQPYRVINGVKPSDQRPNKPSGYSDKYEPYLVIKKTADTPLFDERFLGYGMNKVTFITELFASNYTFFVLPDLWITHFPHKNSVYSQEFLQNTHLRLKNRFARFQFICDLISKYNLTG